jgi:hypothetical protein
MISPESLRDELIPPEGLELLTLESETRFKNESPCETLMPFSICPHHRFPLHKSLRLPFLRQRMANGMTHKSRTLRPADSGSNYGIGKMELADAIPLFINRTEGNPTSAVGWALRLAGMLYDTCPHLPLTSAFDPKLTVVTVGFLAPCSAIVGAA